MTAIVDYDAGNLRSAENALLHLGIKHVVTADPDVVRRADRLVIPGDGEARASMDVLDRTGLHQALDEAYQRGVPMLGICIGAQIVLDSSAERETECLGYIAGRARLLSGGEGLKVPHMGWNTLEMVNPHPLMDGVHPDASFYFVHSYGPQLSNSDDLIASCTYGDTFAAVLGHGPVVATQFHPEKSGKPGLRLIANFCDWSP